MPTGPPEASAGGHFPAGVRGQRWVRGPEGGGRRQRAAQTDGRFPTKRQRPPENAGDDQQTAASCGGGDGLSQRVLLPLAP